MKIMKHFKELGLHLVILDKENYAIGVLETRERKGRTITQIRSNGAKYYGHPALALREIARIVANNECEENVPSSWSEVFTDTLRSLSKEFNLNLEGE